VRRLSGSRGRGSAWSSPARSSCAASGCVASSAGWTRASTCALRTRCSGTWGRGVRRARPPRAPGYRRDRAQTPGGDARRPHTSGSADRTARAGGLLQSRDRRAAVHQPPYGAVPPAEGVPEARHHLAQPAQPRSRQPPQPGVADATCDQRLGRCECMPAAGPSLQITRTAAGPGTVAGRPPWTWRGWTAWTASPSPG
jgi:hypothetical protein